MIKEAIVKIVNKEDLTYDEAYTVMNEIMSGETTPTQNAAFSPHSLPKVPEPKQRRNCRLCGCYESARYQGCDRYGTF
jgi:hypothetical protein